MINDVSKGLDRAAVYLDDVGCCLRFWPLGATDTDFLCHNIFPASFKQHAGKVETLTKTRMPDDTKQPRSRMSGIACYRKFLSDLTRRIRSLTSLIKQGA